MKLTDSFRCCGGGSLGSRSCSRGCSCCSSCRSPLPPSGITIRLIWPGTDNTTNTTEHCSWTTSLNHLRISAITQIELLTSTRNMIDPIWIGAIRLPSIRNRASIPRTGKCERYCLSWTSCKYYLHKELKFDHYFPIEMSFISLPINWASISAYIHLIACIFVSRINNTVIIDNISWID